LNRNVRTIALYLLVLVGIAWLVSAYQPQAAVDTLTTGEFYQALTTGRVVKATVLASDHIIEGTYYKPADLVSKKPSQFRRPRAVSSVSARNAWQSARCSMTSLPALESSSVTYLRRGMRIL